MVGWFVKVKDISMLGFKAMKNLLHNYHGANPRIFPPSERQDSYLQKAFGAVFTAYASALECMAVWVIVVTFHLLGTILSTLKFAILHALATLGIYGTHFHSKSRGDNGLQGQRNRFQARSGGVAELAGNMENSRQAHREGESRSTPTRDGGGCTAFPYSRYDQHQGS